MVSAADGDHVSESPTNSSPSSSPAESPFSEPPTPSPPLSVPSEQNLQAPCSMSPPPRTNSNPLGHLESERRPKPPAPTMSRTGSGLPSDIAARMDAMRLSRQSSPAVNAQQPSANPNQTAAGGVGRPPSSSPRLGPGGLPNNFRMPPGVGRPTPMSPSSGPLPARGPGGVPSLSQQRGSLSSGALSGRGPAVKGHPAKKRPGLTLSQMNSSSSIDSRTDSESGESATKPAETGSLMDKYAEYIDAKTGTLRFKGKATITNHGVDFTGGKSFTISLDEVDTLDELGKGNYGTVYKVRHARPRIRVPGLGLAGSKSHSSSLSNEISGSPVESSTVSPTSSVSAGGTGVIMAMKEIRLELDDAKFAAIIMELDILHRCLSPYIVDFYGAFFQEGAVYICLEFMDGGSIDKLYGDGIPEPILRKITLSATLGLKSLKDEHNIIHRDVKPTNILINTRGQVKICDFGVSGNLVASIAKTNIGCHSYMAPERISSGGVAQAGANPGGGTYSVQSDIWSLGLTIIECALGRYPYPPETYDNIFSQLSAIVDGEPPDLPADSFSPAAHNFVSGCLMKIPNLRPTYSMLLQHAWLAPLVKPATISEEDEEAAEAAPSLSPDSLSPTTPTSGIVDQEVADWVVAALERRRARRANPSAAGNSARRPALHAAPLDVVSSPAVESGSLEAATAPAVEIH